MELVTAEGISINDDEIRERFRRAGRAQYTERYIAMEGGAEVGFLAVDPIPENTHFLIHTLFVPERLRGQAIGSRLLDAAEQLGRSYGYRLVSLNPRPLDPEMTKDALLSWYRKRGYELAPPPNPAGDVIKQI
jgi:GNAT superfamily N-acetyltransferase